MCNCGGGGARRSAARARAANRSVAAAAPTPSVRQISASSAFPALAPAVTTSAVGFLQHRQQQPSIRGHLGGYSRAVVQAAQAAQAARFAPVITVPAVTAPETVPIPPAMTAAATAAVFTASRRLSSSFLVRPRSIVLARQPPPAPAPVPVSSQTIDVNFPTAADITTAASASGAASGVVNP